MKPPNNVVNIGEWKAAHLKQMLALSLNRLPKVEKTSA
jgi:hypothetical protein